MTQSAEQERAEFLKANIRGPFNEALNHREQGIAFAAWQAARREQVVPKEPTSKQVVLGAGALLGQPEHTADNRHPDWRSAVEKVRKVYMTMLAAAPQPPEAESVPVGAMCLGKAGELVPQWIMYADGLEIVFGCSCLLYKSERGIEVLRVDSGKGSCIKFGVPDTATEVLQPSGILHFHQTAASFCAEIAGESKSEAACNPSMQPELATMAAPVQMPEPAGWVDDGGMLFWTEDAPPDGENIYTEYQVRQLLAAHGVKFKG